IMNPDHTTPAQEHPRVRRIKNQIAEAGYGTWFYDVRLLYVLGPRRGWRFDVGALDIGLDEAWSYEPSLPAEQSEDDLPTPVYVFSEEMNGVAGFQVDPPSHDGALSSFSRFYSSVDELIADLEALERWRAPIDGDPPGATGGRRLGLESHKDVESDGLNE
ncbi:hypothetical protein GR250_39605, partial [Rhizobium leguminosarum]|nr:hypothetical protein [Rhizobium leguminosarum]